MKVTYYVATSVDGYIAKLDGDVSWLDTLGISPEETGYEEFLSSVDGLVMGRNTYEFIYNYGKWPYNNIPTWVCTSKSLDVIEGCQLQEGKNLNSVIKEAKSLGIEHLWLVGGGKLAASFINDKALTHLSISHMPIILGSGIKLFGDLKAPVKIKQQSAHSLPSGFTQLEFEVVYD